MSKYIIFLVGLDGSGKSTLTRELSKNFGFKEIYGGWKKYYLPTSWLISKIGTYNKSGGKIRKKLNEERAKNKVSFIQECIYLNYVFEHLTRYYISYFFNSKIIFDRSFFDIYFQNSVAYQSKVLSYFFKKFPKPTHFIYLNPGKNILLSRKPDENTSKKIDFQLKNIEKLKHKINLIEIDSTRKVDDIIKEILINFPN